MIGAGASRVASASAPGEGSAGRMVGPSSPDAWPTIVCASISARQDAQVSPEAATGRPQRTHVAGGGLGVLLTGL
jgi:hypothetical protein